MSGVRPGTITVVITDTDWSLWPDHPRVIDSRDNDNQQQPILSQQQAESGSKAGFGQHYSLHNYIFYQERECNSYIFFGIFIELLTCLADKK